jgi:hypothetical protein
MKFTKSITVLGMTELIAALASGELKPRANTETENGNENDPAPINLRPRAIFPIKLAFFGI